jgi:hypothetical protein
LIVVGKIHHLNTIAFLTFATMESQGNLRLLASFSEKTRSLIQFRRLCKNYG